MGINFDKKQDCAYQPSHNAHERSLHAIQPYKRKSDWEITLRWLSVYYDKEQSFAMAPFNWGDRWIELSLFTLSGVNSSVVNQQALKRPAMLSEKPWLQTQAGPRRSLKNTSWNHASCD